jgi:hypothetical protein
VGLWGALSAKLLELNMSYGPWQSSARMRILEDGAMDASKLLDVNGPLLLPLWQSI